MMRLVHILSSNRWSGVEKYALDICRHYARKGVDVMAVTRDARAVDDAFRDEGIPLVFAPLHGYISISSLETLIRLINGTGEDDRIVFHCHAPADAYLALSAKRLAKGGNVKIVFTQHHVKKASRMLLNKFVYRNVDSIIFVSNLVKDRFLSRWDKNPKALETLAENVVIHNSILDPLPEPVSEPEKGPVTAMYHGRLAPGKGLETLIDALALLQGKKPRLRLVGSGHPDYVDSLRHRAVTLGVMPLIDWPRHRQDPMELIKECHFGVLPADEPEAFGIANIEYMAAGRAQICSRNGAQPEYITDGKEGILISPGNPILLAEQMRFLSRHPEARRKMGELARKKFEKSLSWPRFIRELDVIYKY